VKTNKLLHLQFTYVLINLPRQFFRTSEAAFETRAVSDLSSVTACNYPFVNPPLRLYRRTVIPSGVYMYALMEDEWVTRWDTRHCHCATLRPWNRFGTEIIPLHTDLASAKTALTI